jgi:hypothetical protein
MKKYGLLLAVCAGSACTVAVANDSDLVNLPAIAAQAPSGGFSTRGSLVYGNPFPGNGGDFRVWSAASRRVGDDFNTSPAGPHTITGALYGVVYPAAGPGGADLDLTAAVILYDSAANFLARTDGVAPGTVLLGEGTNALAAFGTPGYITYFAAPVNFDAAGFINLPDSNGFGVVECRVINTTTLHPSYYPVGRGAASTIVNPGTTDGNNWSDVNNDGLFNLATELHNPNTTSFRALYLGLQAGIPCPAEPTLDGTQGTLADGVTTRTGTVGANQVRWYDFTLAGDATDALRQFIDLDTEGSASDVAIGVYDPSVANCGLLVGNIGTGTDDDSGSGTNAQLTFGTGRRAKVLDGRDYDGRDGEIIAGRYIVGVAPGGSSFGPGYNVSFGPGTGGNFTLNFNTNTNGAALAASVAPTDISLLQDIGDIANQPVLIATTSNVEPYEHSWWTFCTSGATAGGAEFIDIDFSATVIPADGQAHIFDANGNVLFSSDDYIPGTYFQPGFSFGATATRNYGGVPNYTGAEGTLAPGLYYIGAGLFETAPLLAGDRWHLRSDEGSSLDINFTIYNNTTVAGPCTTACDDLDFNNDEVSPDTLDIEDLLSVFGGGPCSTDPSPGCNDLDFNNDGVAPDTLDLELFLQVFGGGTCP